MNNSEILGEEAAVRQIVEDDFSATNGHFEDDSITELRASAFRKKKTLKSVNFPNVIKLTNDVFNESSRLTFVNFPKLTTLSGGYNFRATRLKELSLPSLIGATQGYLASGSTGPYLIDLGEGCTTAGNYISWSRTFLDAIILRSSSRVVSLGSWDASPVNGIGHVYVPRALISSYQTATNWSKEYAKQNDLFRAIEDYTVDGTVTGEFNKELLKANLTPVYAATNLEFDGLSQYVDTGVKLFDSDNKFTILIEMSASTTHAANPGSRLLIHCRDESSTNGVSIFNNANSINSMYVNWKSTDATNFNQLLNTFSGNHDKIVIRSTGDRLTYVDYNAGSDSFGNSGCADKLGTLQNISNNLIIGAKDVNGTKSLFWSGIVHDIKVYKGCLSGMEIREWLNV